MPVERIGNGMTACFAIPGWGEDRNCFSPLENLLSPQASLFSVDPPGYGSSPPPASYTFDEITSRLHNELRDAQAMSGGRIRTLLGNCSGALLACELAMRLEEAPQRMLLIDPFAFLPGYFRLFLRRDFGRHAYNSTFANPVGRWLTNLLARGKDDNSTDMTESFRSVNHEVTYGYLEMFGTHQGIGQYAGIRSEVTIVTGEKTFAAVKNSVGMWQEIWPHAQVVTIPDCGHLPVREAPEALVAALFGSTAAEVGIN